ncbi:MAG: fatty acid desaturase, partial [Flavobacteriales bacterium]
MTSHLLSIFDLILFLYWHMNWHTEHHLYAGVPCYNLKKLHQAVKD